MGRPPVSEPVKIVIDQNIRGAGSTFERHARLVRMEGRQIRREHLLDADALIVRTATAVNEDLLSGTGVGFVGTTSIGVDHLDISWLDRSGIPWANAPGCNADSAAQYTLAMIWLACRRLGRDLDGLGVGVIGRGNVGSRVKAMLEGLGVRVVANDPPLEDLGVTPLVPLEDALAQDVVCLHVPLTDDGPYPTRGMLGSDQIGRMPEGALLVNTARGDVVDGAAIGRALGAGRIHAALDVWPGEPRIDPRLLKRATVATPHVAGYSDDGKWLGTRMVYEAFCRWAALDPEPPEPPGQVHELAIPDASDPVLEALEAACFVQYHDREMRDLLPLSPQSRSAGFDRLRRDYPRRRDFKAWQIEGPAGRAAEILQALGFQVVFRELPPGA
jgi:erythronate-4-phosphate dehydrogenase